MSVLNQSGEEQVECPLCMEPLEVDDLNFYPCTCGYQICRFCWHRIRTDENGLCPACRKAYSENPADFTPLSQEQVAKIKAEKRQRDQQRKAKLSESRKHLASVRVVQRNLVFVVGLPMRLADPETLRRHEYFGKFGKIHKVVINQSTAYAGSQGPSASAYVTYVKSEDALRAIQSVNNITIDGRLVKSSLGTTKYCSHFMKNQSCPKSDCMYLHDFGDPEASFTKEEMHAGKHQEYEKKLHDQLVHKTQTSGPQSTTDCGRTSSRSREPSTSTTSTANHTSTNGNTNGNGNGNNNGSHHNTNNNGGGGSSNNSNGNKDTWPQLNNGDEKKPDKKSENGREKPEKSRKKRSDKKDKSKGSHSNGGGADGSSKLSNTCSRDSVKSSDSSRTDKHAGSNSGGSCNSDRRRVNSNNNNSKNNRTNSHNSCSSSSSREEVSPSTTPPSNTSSLTVPSPATSVDSTTQHNLTVPAALSLSPPTTTTTAAVSTATSSSTLDDNSSFFSSNTFQKLVPEHQPKGDAPLSTDCAPGDGTSPLSTGHPQQPSHLMTDCLPDIDTSEDWMAAFGFAEQRSYIESLAGLKQCTKEPSLDGVGTNGYGPFTNAAEHSLGSKQDYNRFCDMFKLGQEAPASAAPLYGKNGYGYGKLEPSMASCHYGLSATQNNGKVLAAAAATAAAAAAAAAAQNCTTNGRTHPLTAANNGSGVGGMDQMSKFLLDTAQKRKFQPTTVYSNGENGQNGGMHYGAPFDLQKTMQTQQEIEEQLLQLSLSRYCDPQKQAKHFPPQQQQQQHSIAPQQPLNGARYTTAPHLYQNGFTHDGGALHEEDELDFDPIQETQKAFAELIASEQTHAHIGRGRSSVPTNQLNGISHNHSGLGHLPPPPPGFVQPNSHMNSFGSKILPFLNMASSQQPLNGGTSPQTSWTNGFAQFQSQSPQLQQTQQLRPQQQPQIRQQFQQQAQHKSINNCHDWKTLDPAILSSSRHFPLASMPPTASNYALQQQLDSQQQQQQHQQQQPQTGAHTAPFRYFDYSNFSHINTQQNLNWFTSELNSQINSPPGFRNPTQTSKQQEC